MDDRKKVLQEAKRRLEKPERNSSDVVERMVRQVGDDALSESEAEDIARKLLEGL